jgi:cytoskeleton protein RodZ
MTDQILLTAATVRKNAGVSLREISERTKISMRNLEAIEGGEFKRLPGGVYATSYIRQYARAIGYDEFELLGLYHQVTGAPQTIPQLDKVQNPSSPGFRPLFQY